MLFAPKNKGFFVEKNDHGWMLARTSSASAPLVVEELREVRLNDPEALKAVISEIQPKAHPSGYLHADCGVYPPKRLLRCGTIEPRRAKEANYLSEFCSQQFRIEHEKYIIALLDAATGTQCDISQVLPKELLFCGLLNEEVVSNQDTMLEAGIYPTRLELGSVALLGGIVDTLVFSGSKSPTLVLEIGSDATHSFIVGADGVEASRPIPFGIESMLPVVHRKLNLKDEESARKLFYSNTFDFTSMGPELVQRLLKELQSSIGFFEVQTGQSIGQLICTALPSQLSWIESSIGSSLGVATVKLDIPAWLASHRITLSDRALAVSPDSRWLGLLSLLVSHHTPAVPHAAAL